MFHLYEGEQYYGEMNAGSKGRKPKTNTEDRKKCEQMYFKPPEYSETELMTLVYCEICIFISSPYMM